MRVQVRPYKRWDKKTKASVIVPGTWEVDIRGKFPTGERFREKTRSMLTSKSAVRRWGEQRAAYLAANGIQQKQEEKPPPPTLAEFAPEFIKWAVNQRQKPSTISSKEAVLNYHLKPLLGGVRLDALNERSVEKVRTRLKDRSAKTVNNVLCTLSKLLKVAVKLKVIHAAPVTIELLKIDDTEEMAFYEFEQYEGLVEAAAKLDPRTHLTVLLGGDAGLRTGEMLALEQTDVDYRRGLLLIGRSEWKGQVTTTKGGKSRTVPMTERLARALKTHQHMRGDRVLYRDDGTPMSEETLRGWVRAAQRRANLKGTGGKHILRHTFCSHLAMQGRSPQEIQKLAGHADLTTTMRYMHLSPSHLDEAIKTLEAGRLKRQSEMVQRRSSTQENAATS